MNNLLARTLFISLLLSITTFPAAKEKTAVKKEKTKSNRWEKIRDEIVIAGAIVGVGTLMGYVMGRKIGGDAWAFAGAQVARATGLSVGTEVTATLIQRFTGVPVSVEVKVGTVAENAIQIFRPNSPDCVAQMVFKAGTEYTAKILNSGKIKEGAVLGYTIGRKKGGKPGALVGAKAGGLVALIRILLEK